MDNATRGRLQSMVTCDECEALNQHGAHFCDECGAVLQPVEPEHPSAAAMRHRREANSALRHGYKWIDGITWLYRTGALGYAGVTAIAILALGTIEVPLGPGMLVVALSTVMTVLMLMGAIQILFEPFTWTVIIALAATIVSVVHFVGPNPLGLAALFSAAWAVAFWAAVLPTARFRKLMTEHEDTYILHHASAHTRRSVEGRSPRDRHQRLVRVMRRAGERAWKVSLAAGALIVVVSALGAWAVCGSVRPHALSSTLEGFEAAWNGADFEAVDGWLWPKVYAQESTRLANLVDGHGWRSAPPHLAGGRTRAGDDDRTWVDYELGSDTLSASWVLDDRDWYLVELDLPVPPLAPAIERFMQAWRSSDVNAIADFFPPDYVERMRKSIQHSVELRSWKPLPEVLRKNVSDHAAGEATATLAVEGGEVTTKWLLRGDGAWGLQSIQFPQR